MKTSIYRSTVLLALAFLLTGCLTQKPKWMVEFISDPDALNHTFANDSGLILYAHELGGNLVIEHFDSLGTNTHTSSMQIDLDQSKGFVALPNGNFFTSGNAPETVSYVDTSAETFWQGATTTSLQEGETFDIAGTYGYQGNLALYGAVQAGGNDTKGIIIIVDEFGNETSNFSIEGVTRFNEITTEPSGNIAVQTTNQIITLSDTFAEIGRFTLPSGKSLIALSLDHPVLFVSSGADIQRVDANGIIKWTYDNPDISSIKGQSTDENGNIVVWGDKASYNVFNMKTDLATFDKITINGERQWLFQSEDKMNVIKYVGIDHRSNGDTTVSYQGWKGELAGLLIGGTTATPVRVTRMIQHDTISALGNRATHRVEPARTEVYAQCGFLCIGITSETEGHCESLDVAYIDKNIVTVSKVCGAANDDAVKVSYF
ncbi:hypothetical protein A9Q81_11575 [Gammaproteobacteria bacterium 42_54_T18]|nr:hypothetical protein A9Q81_11575 [Gammaproteobacteria bacterium 42_54_T18]